MVELNPGCHKCDAQIALSDQSNINAWHVFDFPGEIWEDLSGMPFLPFTHTRICDDPDREKEAEWKVGYTTLVKPDYKFLWIS